MLVMMSAQELSNGISYSGHMYAMTRAARSLTPTADLQETFSGMDQVSDETCSDVVPQPLRNSRRISCFINLWYFNFRLNL